MFFKEVISFPDKSNDSNEVKPSNIDSIEVTFELGIFGNLTDFKVLISLNKPAKVVNEEPKFDKSIYSSEVKPLNKFSTEVILDESKLEKSKDTNLSLFSSFTKKLSIFSKGKTNFSSNFSFCAIEIEEFLFII